MGSNRSDQKSLRLHSFIWPGSGSSRRSRLATTLGLPFLKATAPAKLARRLWRRRQRRKDQKAVVAVDGTSIHDVSDDLLRLILLRLDSPIWLMRAASACKRWRHIVTEGPDEARAFLRLASSLHPPTVVGQYHDKDSGDIWFVPNSSPVNVNHFSVDFIDKNSRWYVVDCHGGLVLLRMSTGPNLIVYDPLTRQHRPISGPPPPPKNQVSGYGSKGTFLFNGDDSNISISNFRVLYLLNAAAPAADPHACVFSTANGGGWNWHFLSGSADEDIFLHRCAYVAGRADGSLYLGLIMASGLGSGIVALDSTSMVLSRVDLPTHLNTSSSLFCASSFTVVHGAGDLTPTTSAARTSIVHVYGQKLELFRRVHASGEWVLEHTIANLSEATRGISMCLEKKVFVEWINMASIIEDGAAFAILSAKSPDSYTNSQRWFFSLDINTMELRVLPQEIYRGTNKIRNYTLPWPQFLRACPCF